MAWKSWAVGCAFTAASMAVQPLTLGKERGAAWIGQPLELLVAVQLDPGENEVCAQADVFHADSRQDPARVRVTVEPGNQGESRTLRINSATLVDEPVVSVYLSVGCSQKSTRKYVLLADFPNSPSAPIAPPAPLVSPAALAAPTALAPLPQSPTMPTADGAVAQAPAATPTTAVAPAATAATAAAAPSAAAEATPARRKKAATAPASATSTATSKAGKPRLQLDPLDTLSERARPLDDGMSAPGTRDAERIARLQKDVRALLEQAAKNEASLMALQAQLLQSQARSEPWSPVLLYALIALTLGSFAGMGWMWVRRTPLR